MVLAAFAETLHLPPKTPSSFTRTAWPKPKGRSHMALPTTSRSWSCARY